MSDTVPSWPCKLSDAPWISANFLVSGNGDCTRDRHFQRRVQFFNRVFIDMSTDPKAYLLRFMDGSGRVVIAGSFGEAVAAEFEQVVSGKEIERKGKDATL